MKNYLNSRAAAEYLGVSTKTIYRKRCTGELRYYHFGSVIRYLKNDLDEFVQAHVMEPFATKTGGSNG